MHILQGKCILFTIFELSTANDSTQFTKRNTYRPTRKKERETREEWRKTTKKKNKKKIFKQKPNKYGATREMRLTLTCGALQLTNESAMDCLP